MIVITMTRPYAGSALLALSMLLSACGGGGGGDAAPVSGGPTSGSPPPSSPSPPPDTTPPTVSVKASVASDTVTFVATANDNIAVSSVSFFVDDGAIQGAVQKSPSDGSYSLQIPSNILGVGEHKVSALAGDGAGNTATSGAVAFTVRSQPATEPDTTSPTVAAGVEGNFGLVKLTAIAKDNARIDSVSFLIDGAQTPIRATPAYVATDPADQYFRRLDTTGLSNGPHYVIARARDRSFNSTDSAEVVFNVDASAGVTELEENDSIATAMVVARAQSQIAGTLANVTTTVDTTQVVRPDTDYYRISLGAGETVSIDMLSTQGFFLGVVDANGQTLSNPSALVSSDVTNVSYSNGSTPQDVYIRVTSGNYDFKTNNQYKLSLSYR